MDPVPGDLFSGRGKRMRGKAESVLVWDRGFMLPNVFLTLKRRAEK